jgi:hypothetical protein
MTCRSTIAPATSTPTTSVAPDFLQREEWLWYLNWMQSMPGRGNNIPHGDQMMTNWREFVRDWDGAIARQMHARATPAGH